MNDALYYQILGLLLAAAGPSCDMCRMGHVPVVNDMNVWHHSQSGRVNPTCGAAHVWQLSDLRGFIYRVSQ